MKPIGAVLLVLSICLLSGVSWAQYYYYNGYVYQYPPAYNSAPPPNPQVPNAQIQRPQQPRAGAKGTWAGLRPFFRSKSVPETIRHWDRNNRVDDFLELQRGTLGRETDLEYMLRTF
ncbi:MAG: hypothetical protein HY914_04745 [Desulfomonile tiedjei]|nr:hypothetical protein [Desulfomonile tiedjei]